MANNVEERIVQMKFDNAQFEQGIKTSMSSLESFNKSLKNKEGTKGLTEISSGMEKITNISSGMIAKFAAITNVINSAMNAGKNFVKAITIDPITTGLNEYELKMGSVQTIMNGTGESLDVVMDKLEELNKYADRTIYSFQDMTSNIGKFTNAGVKLDVATKAIQGVSNLAAVSGASALDASRAMYNISQALGTGYMQLIDWKSIENANMATLEFKQTLIDTAKEVGTLNDKSKVTAENFRETLKNGWLTNDVLLRTLTKYTDETTELGKKAFAAATEIKTATQLFDVMKESVQSGWAITWENIIGNFDEAKQLFTGFGQVFDFFASKSADARNSVLADWKELGGRQAIIQSLYNTFANLLLIIKPFKDAFRDVFPPTTGKTLADLSNKLKDFTGKVWISKDAADGLKNILTLLLTPLKAVTNGLKMGWSVAKVFAAVLWYLSQAFLALFKDMNSFESILKKIFGDDRYARILTAWNKLLGNIQNGVISLITGVIDLGNAISNTSFFKTINKEISDFIDSGIDEFLDMMIEIFESMANLDFTLPDIDLSFLNGYMSLDDILGLIIEKYESVKKSIDEFFGTFNKGNSFLNAFKEQLGVVLEKLKELNERITPSKILLVAFGISLVALIARFTKVGKAVGELVESVTRVTKGIGKIFKTLSFDKKATGILKIATAFGVLAASLVALTLVDSNKLLGAAVALGVLGAELTAITFILGKFTNFGDIMQVMGSLVALATSIMVITNALKTLNRIEIAKDIWKKLEILAAALAGFSAIAIALSKLAPKMSGGSLFLVAFAFSVDKLVTAMGKLNELKMTASEGIIKELIALMGLIGGFVLIAGRMKLSSAAGVVLLASAIDILIGAFNKIRGTIDVSGLSKVFDNVKNAVIKTKDFILDSSISDLKKYAASIITVSAGLLAFGGALYFILSGMNSLSKGIIRIAVAAAIVIASLKMLENIKPETIDNGIKAIKQIFESFMGLTAVLGLFSGGYSFDNKELNGSGGLFQTINGLSKGMKAIAQLGKSASKIGTAMIKLSVAVGILVGVIKLMEYLDPEKMRTNLIAVEILLSTFGVLVAMTAFAKKAGPIIALASIIGTLVAALALFTLIDGNELMQSAICLAAAFVSVGLFIKSLNNIDFKEALSGVIALIGITSSLVAVMYGLKLMGDFDWDNGLKATASLTLLAIGLSTAAKTLSKIKSFDELGSSLIAFVGIAATITGVGIVLGKFAKEFYGIDWSSLIAGSVSLGIMANAFASASVILSKAKFDNFKSLTQNLLSFLAVAGTMVGVGVALGKFAQEFMNIPFTGLISGAVSLGIMANAFAAATIVLSKADFSSFSRMGQNIAAFAGIAATMVGVGISLGKFAQEFMAVPFGSLASSAISLGIMANAFAAATIVLSKANFGSFETMAQSVIGFIGIAASMSIAANLLAPAFQKVADIPWNTLIGAGAAVAEMAVGMSLATGVLSLFAGVIQNNVIGMIVGAGAMIAVGAAARLLAPALKQLAGIKFSSLVKGLVSLVAVLGSLGAVAYVFGNAMGQILPGIAILAAFVAALYFLIPPLEQLSEIDFVDAIGGIGALAVAIVALGACSYILGSLVPQMALGAAVLIAFGAALRLIVPPLEQLSEVDFMSALGGIGALTVAIVALGACSAILGSFAGVMLLGSVSIAAFGVALMVLTPQLERVSQLDFMSVVQGIGALTVAIVAMGVCAGILGTLFPIMAGGVVILTGFGVAVGVLSVALGLGATAVESFGAALSTLPSPLASLGELDLSGTAGGLTLIALACGALGLAGSLLVPASVGITALAASMELLSAAISSLNTTIENASSLANLFQAGLDLISDLIAGITEGISDLWQAGVDAVAGFADGVAQGAKDIWNTGVNLASNFINGVRSKNGLDSHSPALALVSAALDAVAGWVKGTDKGQKAIAQSGKDTANTYINAEEKVISKEVPKVANEATDKYVDTVKSDEKKYEKAGEAVTEAQAEGMKDGADLIEKAGEKNGLTSIQGILEGMKESMPGLSSQIDAVGGFIEDKFGATLSTIDLSAPMQALIERSGISGLMDTFGLGGDTSEGEGEDSSGIEDLFSGYSSGLDSVGKSGSGAVKGVKEATDSLAELRDQIESDMDIFSKFDDTVDITVSDMIVNLQSQLDGVSKWSRDLQNLTAKGFDEAFVQELAEKGLSGYKYVEAMQEATQEQIFTYNLMYKEATKSADAAIEYIKQALPTLTAKIAEETGKTIELVGYATEETEKATEAIEDAKEPVDELAESIENENEQTEEMSEQMEETQVTIDGTTESVGDLADGMEATEETMNGTTESVNNLAEGMNDTQETIEGVSDATEDVSNNMGEAAENTEGLGNAITFSTEQAVEFVKGLAKIDSELETMKQSLKETIESQMDIFEKFDNESTISKEELLANMQSQINGITSWASNINNLADKGINEGLLAYLRDLGPEGSKYVNAFIQMSETELAKAGELYETSLVLPDTVSQQMIDKMKMSGTYSIQGLIDSIAAMQPTVYNAGVETANAYNDGYTDTEQIHSPSKVQYNNGVNDAQGLINGINSMSSKVGTTGKQMAYKLKNAINDVVNYDVFYKVGKNVDQGMADGIHDMAYKVATQAAQMAKQAYDAACKSLGINSPSKMFYDIGMYSDLGLVNGFRDYAGVVQTASESVGETALESMADVIAKLNAYAISDIEDPVIRPILDLSEIQNGVRDVNSMLDFGGSYKLASSATKSFATSQGATVTYTNNNDNSDVVNAIGQLRADLSNLNVRLGNIQVVMDTGTLVGELVDPMDQALGQKMNFNGRGV